MNQYVNRIEKMLCGQVLTTSVANELRAIIDLCDKQDTAPLPRKEVISIQPGDVPVLTFPHMLSEEGNRLAEEGMNRLFPHNEALILDGGTTLEVYREQGKPSKASNCPGVCSKCNMRCMDRQEPEEPQIERNEGLM